MKPFSKQTSKWLLSAAMIAALGSQYYFSISSNSIGSFEMSSLSPEELKAKLELLNSQERISKEDYDKQYKEIMDQAPPAPAKKDDAKKPAAAANSKVDPEMLKKMQAAFAGSGKKISVDDKGHLVVENDSKAKNDSAAPVIDGDREFRVADEQVRFAKQAGANQVGIKVDAAQLKTLQDKFVNTGLKISADANGNLKIESNPAAKVEGQNPTTDCKECQQYTVTATPEAMLQISNLLNHIQPKASGAAVNGVVAAPTAKAEDVKPETAHERYEREKEERQAKRDAADEAKRDKEEQKAQAARDKKDQRNDKFADKAEQMADRCGEDLQCKVSGFASLVSSYSSKNNMVDSFALTKAYNQYIDRDLKDALRSDDPSTHSAALAAVDKLMSMPNLPNEYKSLKTRTLDSVKLAQISDATDINEKYKQANDLTKQADLFKNQHKVAEEVETRRQALLVSSTAQKEDALFRNEVNTTYTTIKQGLQTADDKSTMDYVMKNYVPDIQSIVSKLTNLGGINTDSTTTVGNRGGRTGNSPGSTVSSTVNNGNILSGVRFGTESATRTGNRTGVNVKDQ